MRKLSALLLVMVVFCTLLLPVSANVDSAEKRFGIILGVEESGLGTVCEILFLGTDGEEYTYTLAGRLIYNGDRWNDSEIAEILKDAQWIYASYRLNTSGKISWIDFEQEDEGSYLYKDALYDSTKKCFTAWDEEGELVQTYSNLPVYMDDGSNSEIYLDENHVYDIWVSRLGVSIGNFRAKEPFECTLSGIESGDYVGSGFSARIDVYGYISCDSIDASFISETKVVSEIYDKNGNFIGKNESDEIWEDWELCFNAIALDNVNTFGKEYTIKIHLENASGEELSPTYAIKHKMHDYEIKYGYLKDTAMIDGGLAGSDAAEVLISDSDGVENCLRIDKRSCLMYVRDIEDEEEYVESSYVDIENLDECLPCPVYIKYLSHKNGDEEVIKIIAIDNKTQKYAEARYDAERNTFICGEKTIPAENVYCNENMLYNENHVYDVSIYSYVYGYDFDENKLLYDYGVFVHGWSVSGYSCYLTSYEISNGLDNEYKNGIDVEWYASGEGFECIKAELYNSNGQKIGEQTAGEEWVIFEDLPNEACEYTLKMQLLNADNEVVSPLYEVKYNARCCEIGFGYLWQKGVTNSLGGDIAEIKAIDNSGEEKIYTLAYKVSINGGSFVKSADEIDNIPTYSFIKVALNSQGNIHRLNFDNEPNEIYAGVEYDRGKNGFLKDGAEIPVLPIYNDYDKTCRAYLDENHLYDIEVYDTGINVTNYYAKDKEYTVQNLEVSNFRDKHFKHYLGVYGYIYSYDASEGISLLSGAEYTGNNIEAKITIKNFKNEIVAEENIRCEDEYVDYSIEVADSKEEYSVSVELLQNGEAASYTYEESHTAEPVEIKYGHIISCNDTTMVVKELGSYEYTEEDFLPSRIYVNGEEVQELTSPVYGKYFIEGRKITIETFRLIGTLYEDEKFVDVVVRSAERVYDEEGSFAYSRKSGKEYKVKLFSEQDGKIIKIQ